MQNVWYNKIHPNDQVVKYNILGMSNAKCKLIHLKKVHIPNINDHWNDVQKRLCITCYATTVKYMYCFDPNWSYTHKICTISISDFRDSL